MKANVLTMMVILFLIIPTALISPAPAETPKPETRWAPTVCEMMTYEKWGHPEPPVDPLPESDLTDIVFSDAWLLKNDMDTRTDNIKITFPVSWLSQRPDIAGDDIAVRLRIPRSMLEIEDTNKDPSEITVSLSSSLFEGYSDSSTSAARATQLPDVGSLISAGDSTTVTEWCDGYNYYCARRWYDTNRSDLTWVKGNTTCATTNTNPNRYPFFTYHEWEIEFGSGNYVEFIYDYDHQGGTAASHNYWAAIWENGVWKTGNHWFCIPVQPGNLVEFYCYRLFDSQRQQKYYQLYYKKSGIWYSASYYVTVSNPDHITSISPSSEFHPTRPIGTGFRVYSPGNVTGLGPDAGGNWVLPSTVLSSSSWQDQQYVEVVPSFVYGYLYSLQKTAYDR